MARSTVDRIVVSSRIHAGSDASRWMVLVAVALGLLFGALACATDLAGDRAHAAHRTSMIDLGAMASDHSGHSDHPSAAMSRASGHQPSPSAGDSMAGDHPGMACVAPVDLRPLGAAVLPVADRHELVSTMMRAGCPHDVEPPVPRFS